MWLAYSCAAQEIAEHKGIPSFWVDTAGRIDVQSNKVSGLGNITAVRPCRLLLTPTGSPRPAIRLLGT